VVYAPSVSLGVAKRDANGRIERSEAARRDQAADRLPERSARIHRRSRRATRLWRIRLALEHAVADDTGGKRTQSSEKAADAIVSWLVILAIVVLAVFSSIHGRMERSSSVTGVVADYRARRAVQSVLSISLGR
jgi:hypothetical protein